MISPYRLGPICALLALTAAGCSRPAPHESAVPIAITARDSSPPPPPAAKSFGEAIQLATAAARRNDNGVTVLYLEQAEAIAPGHPAILDQIAKYRLRVGDTTGSLAALERLAVLGRAIPVTRDTLYAPLFGHPSFGRIAERMSAAAAPMVVSDSAVVVREPDLLVEAMAHHRAADGTLHLYLGSMSTGRIVRVTAGSAAAPVQVARADGRVLGMQVDARQRLWANVWRPALVPPDSTHPLGTSSLHVYDLATGALLRRFHSPVDGVAHLFNDIALGDDGQAWITDSDAGRVYHADLRTGELTALVAGAPDITYPNGVALSVDRSQLYFAHSEGVSAVDLRTRQRTRVAHGPTVTLTGIDGLYACGTGLIGVQRLAGFDRIAWFELSGDGRRVTATAPLEQAHPAYLQPTTGTVVGDSLYYIATSELRRHLPDGSIAPPTAPSRTLVLRLPLGGRCR